MTLGCRPLISLRPNTWPITLSIFASGADLHVASDELNVPTSPFRLNFQIRSVRWPINGMSRGGIEKSRKCIYYPVSSEFSLSFTRQRIIGSSRLRIWDFLVFSPKYSAVHV